jgi:hypothetical protein
MRRLAIVALALLASATSEAQTLVQRPVSQGAVTPADMAERLEKSAARTRAQAPKGAARGSSIDFCWPSSVAEYQAIGKYVLVLVSVVTQDAAELPLRRVYVTVNGEQTELIRLSSQRRDVGKGSTTFSILGPFREDGFYVAPAGETAICKPTSRPAVTISISTSCRARRLTSSERTITRCRPRTRRRTCRR